MPAVLENSTKKIIQFCGMGILPVLVLLGDQMPAPQKILGYFFNWKSPISGIVAIARIVNRYIGTPTKP